MDYSIKYFVRNLRSEGLNFALKEDWQATKLDCMQTTSYLVDGMRFFTQLFLLTPSIIYDSLMLGRHMDNESQISRSNRVNRLDNIN